MTSPSKLQPQRDWILPALAMGVIALLLISFFPYSAGYAGGRLTIGRRLIRFWGNPDWQHGMLVPFILAFLIWQLRHRLGALRVSGSWWGLPLVFLGFFTYWVGYKANVHYFGFAAIQMLAVGGVLWLFGWKHLRALSFPLLFMLFMWPLIFLEDVLAFPLRMVMTEISSGFLNVIGLDNLQVGTAITSASDAAAGLEQGALFQLDIEAPCSGLRSLFALLMVSTLFGYYTLPKAWQRWLLFGLAAPLAVAGNFVRILLLVFGTMAFGSDFAIGKDGGTSDYHFLAGIAVFVVALGGMTLVAAFLRGGIRKVFSRPPERVVRQKAAGTRQIDGPLPPTGTAADAR